MRLRHFLGAGATIGVPLSDVAVRLNEWAAMVLAEGFDAALQEVPGVPYEDCGPDLIYNIAMQLTGTMSGIDAEILRKSVQEVAFKIAGTNPDMTRDQLARRLVSFLRRRGTTGLLRRFLSLHLFNVVWLRTSDSFRSLAFTQASFVHEMENVERGCRRMVDSIWRPQKNSGPLLCSPAELVERLGQRLRRSSIALI